MSRVCLRLLLISFISFIAHQEKLLNPVWGLATIYTDKLMHVRFMMTWRHALPAGMHAWNVIAKLPTAFAGSDRTVCYKVFYLATVAALVIAFTQTCYCCSLLGVGFTQTCWYCSLLSRCRDWWCSTWQTYRKASSLTRLLKPPQTATDQPATETLHSSLSTPRLDLSHKVGHTILSHSLCGGLCFSLWLVGQLLVPSNCLVRSNNLLF